MVSITMDGLDESLERPLRMRAAEKGISVEWGVRNTLAAALREESPVAADLASSIHAKFASFGGVELELPPRDPIGAIPRFAGPLRRPC